MGYGSYSSEAHEVLTKARGNVSTESVFTQQSCHPLMNPRGVRARESRDSPEHPNSVPIVFALDVTGSMGGIPKTLATKSLPHFMKVLEAAGVPDPQLLFMAVGDATSDRAPVQIGQFESTAELMDKWLTWSFLEGGGGGTGSESYELAFYFLAEHTISDAWTKRKKRGYAFLTGDELPYPTVSRHIVDTIFGDHLDNDVPTSAVVAAASETFSTFFLVPDHARAVSCEATWRELLGDHVIVMEGAEDTCFVAAGLVALGEGLVKDVDHLAGIVAASGAPADRVGGIVRALTPYAALVGKDGAPHPPAHAKHAPVIGSLWKRLTHS
jgi:hypothetical protein